MFLTLVGLALLVLGWCVAGIGIATQPGRTRLAGILIAVGSAAGVVAIVNSDESWGGPTPRALIVIALSVVFAAGWLRIATAAVLRPRRATVG